MARTPLLNRVTATKENALTDEERDVFLALKLDARLGTNRGDGWWHVTPIFYLWQDGAFYFTLGKSRRHVRNLRRDAHATVCVDVDPRVEDDWDHRTMPKVVICFGLAQLTELSDNEEFVRTTTDKIVRRYLGSDADKYNDAVWCEGSRTIAVVRPELWLTFDQGK